MLMPSRVLSVSLLAAATVLAGCASAPKVAQVDPSTRRPVNDPAHIEMLRARTDLERARTELELQRRQLAAQRLMEQARMQPVVLRATRDPAVLTASTRGVNLVYTARFPLRSTRLALSAQARAALIDAARQAPLVMLRGRTDATRDNPIDTRLAQQRAESARALLAAGGVDPARIRVTWQGAGDTVAPTDTAEGRALNRRVEIELYNVPPEMLRLEELAAGATVASAR
jgi:outer membrane protein OmpA-like peptidoglycan-associated protein